MKETLAEKVLSFVKPEPFYKPPAGERIVNKILKKLLQKELDRKKNEGE